MQRDPAQYWIQRRVQDFEQCQDLDGAGNWAGIGRRARIGDRSRIVDGVVDGSGSKGANGVAVEIRSGRSIWIDCCFIAFMLFRHAASGHRRKQLCD